MWLQRRPRRNIITKIIRIGMDTLEKHNKEMENRLGKEIFGIDTSRWEISYEYSPQQVRLKSFITSQNKSLLKKIAEGEVKRHNKQIQIHKDIIQMHDQAPFEWHKGRIVEAEENITYWQQVLQDLEK